MGYEKLAERCQISSRYFSNIVRKQSAPSILTLEKLCRELRKTPNQLLLPRDAALLLPYSSLLPACPQCGGPLPELHLLRCAHCGQRLCWRAFAPDALCRPDRGP